MRSRPYQDLPREHGWEPLRVEGQVPPELRGTLYRNGPSTFSSGDGPYRHWFDGDGAVSAFRFADGGVAGAARIVDTPWLRAERAAGRQLYRSYAQLGRGWRRWLQGPKNPANIAVLPWNGRLFALWEAGLPTELDPETLEARGTTNLDGAIGPTFAAHPHRTGEEWVTFGVRYGPTFHLDFYALGAQVVRLGSVPLRFPTVLHDFIVTPRHIVVFCPPVRLRFGRLLAGVGTYEENLVWEPARGAEILVLPRDAAGGGAGFGSGAVRFEVPAFFLWHFVNAWEDGDEIVVDFLRYDDFATNTWFGQVPWREDPLGTGGPPRAGYARARIAHRARTWTVEERWSGAPEFPALPWVPGAPHAHAWFLDLAGAPDLCRLDVETGALRRAPLRPGEWAGEPIHATADWLVAPLHHGRSSGVAVLRAEAPEEGPVARAWLDHAVPFSFHGAWVAA